MSNKLSVLALGACLVLFFASDVLAAPDSPLPSPLPTITASPVPTVAPSPTPTITPAPPPPPAPEDRTVVNILAWIVVGGCGALASIIIEKGLGDWFHDRTPEMKQYIASGLSGGIAVLATLGLIGLGVNDTPADALAWADTLIIAFFIGAGFANLTHARLVLSGKSAG